MDTKTWSCIDNYMTDKVGPITQSKNITFEKNTLKNVAIESKTRISGGILPQCSTEFRALLG